jgi:hypothetical protein
VGVFCSLQSTLLSRLCMVYSTPLIYLFYSPLQYNQEGQEHRERQKQFHKQSVEFRNSTRIWREVDSKRTRTRLLSERLAMLARLSSYMSYAGMTVYVNQSTPSPSEEGANDGLLLTWGVLSVACIVLELTVMIIATILHVSLLEASCREGSVDPSLQYDAAARPEGDVMTVRQLECLWETQYEWWYRRLVLLFSAGLPLTFALLVPLAHIKFPQFPSCAWPATFVCLAGIFIWFRVHRSMVGHLLHVQHTARPASSLTRSTRAAPAAATGDRESGPQAQHLAA